MERKQVDREAYLRTLGAGDAGAKGKSSAKAASSKKTGARATSRDLPPAAPPPAQPPEDPAIEDAPGSDYRSAILQAMEIRVDSLSAALHRLERRQVSLERTIQTLTAAAPPQEAMPKSGEEPAAPQPIWEDDAKARPPKRRLWVSLVFGLLLGLAATAFAALMGVGTTDQKVFVDIFSSSFYAGIDQDLFVRGLNVITAAIGAGVALIAIGLMLLTRSASYRRKLARYG